MSGPVESEIDSTKTYVMPRAPKNAFFLQPAVELETLSLN
jgi:hypothetical protein